MTHRFKGFHVRLADRLIVLQFLIVVDPKYEIISRLSTFHTNGGSWRPTVQFQLHNPLLLLHLRNI